MWRVGESGYPVCPDLGGFALTSVKCDTCTTENSLSLRN